MGNMEHQHLPAWKVRYELGKMEANIHRPVEPVDGDGSDRAPRPMPPELSDSSLPPIGHIAVIGDFEDPRTIS